MGVAAVDDGVAVRLELVELRAEVRLDDVAVRVALDVVDLRAGYVSGETAGGEREVAGFFV